MLPLLFALTLGCHADVNRPRAVAPPNANDESPPRRPELISPLGKPLYALPPGPQRERLEADLAEARRRLAEDPDDPDRIIWVGRRLGYLLRVNDAIDVFSCGIAKHADCASLYRHRGHRYITLRRFDLARVDLRRAADLVRDRPDEIEPDGRPNARNIPLTTLKFNIWYHLALAHYVRGEFEPALHGWTETRRYTRGLDDNVVAVADWTSMTLRRLGRHDEARRALECVQPNMDIIENGAYHRRCLMYQGRIAPAELLDVPGTGDLDQATLGYGLGNWYLCNGDKARAIEAFERVVSGPQWAAFGYIAAEADLTRLRGPR